MATDPNQDRRPNLRDDRTPEPTTSDLAGVWCRTWEEDPIGDGRTKDLTTLVLWIQSPKSGMYIDLRLPMNSSGRPSTTSTMTSNANHSTNPQALDGTGRTLAQPPKTIDDNENDALIDHFHMMTQTKSFAGVLEYTVGDATESNEALEMDPELKQLSTMTTTTTTANMDTTTKSNRAMNHLPLCTCYWKRIIDYQPPSGGFDIGVCASYPVKEQWMVLSNDNVSASIDLRETGDDGSYAELWNRLPGSAAPFRSVFAMELISEDGINRDGYWVRTNNYFAYAIGRPKTKNDAVELGCVPQSHEISSSIGKSLADAVIGIYPTPEDPAEKALCIKSHLSMIGSYVCVFGRVHSDDSGTEPSWTILHSTDPSLVDCTLVGEEMNDRNKNCSVVTISDTAHTSQTQHTLPNNFPPPSPSGFGTVIQQTIKSPLSTHTSKIRLWKIVEMEGPSHIPGLDF